MKRTLLDEGVPIGLVDLLGHDDVHHVNEMRWSGISDSRLIANAVSAGFEVIVTTDQSMPHQQDLRAVPLGLVIVCTTDWTKIREHSADIRTAVKMVKVGSHETCLVPRRGRSRGRRAL